MKNLIQALNEIKELKITISERAGEPIIQATQRAEIKQKMEQAFLKDLDENNEIQFILGETAEGIILGLEHNDLVESKNKLVVGEICFEFNIKVKNLNYDITEKIDEYQTEQEIKQAEKIEKEKNKQAKIKRDKEKYEQKRLEKLAKEKETTE